MIESAPDPRNVESDGTKDGDALATLHARALRHADEAYAHERENIDKGRDDQRFYAGEQWPDDVRQGREKKNRPVITINVLPTSVRQLTGDIRQNTPSIKVLPADDGATETVAKIQNGMVRHIQQRSTAKAAYVQAADNAAITGIGGWRVITEYESDKSFNQVIGIERIVDPFAILMDPLARKIDRSDARYGFIFSDISPEEHRERYPDKTLENFPSFDGGSSGYQWRNADAIKLAEYWYREPVKKTLYLLAGGEVSDKEPTAAEKANGRIVTNKRDVATWQIKSCIMNGKEVLEGPFDWAGKYIPICVVTGEEIYFDGRTVRRGIVRDAKDAQRVYNYMTTAGVEAVAQQPKTPYVGTVKQFGVGTPLEDQWAQAGADNLPFLAYNPDPQAPGPPKRSEPALASAGLDTQKALANEDIKRVTGIFDASLGNKSNETSGIAIQRRQQEGDTGTFYLIDNLNFAIIHCGRIILDLIPKIYDAERIVRVLEEDDTHEMVPVNATVKDPKTGLDTVLNDLTTGNYDVAIVTGPSYATRRVEASESMMSFVQAVPPAGAVISDLVAANMDWPGAEKISERLKRTIPPAILGEEAGPQEPPAPSPTEAADAIKTAAEADKIKAETEGVEIDNRTKLVELQTGMAAFGQTLQGIEALLRQIAGQGAAPQGEAPPALPQPPMGEASPMPAETPELEPLVQPPELEPLQTQPQEQPA